MRATIFEVNPLTAHPSWRAHRQPFLGPCITPSVRTLRIGHFIATGRDNSHDDRAAAGRDACSLLRSLTYERMGARVTAGP